LIKHFLIDRVRNFPNNASLHFLREQIDQRKKDNMGVLQTSEHYRGNQFRKTIVESYHKADCRPL